MCVCGRRRQGRGQRAQRGAGVSGSREAGDQAPVGLGHGRGDGTEGPGAGVIPGARGAGGGACTQHCLDAASDTGTDAARAISDVREQGTQIPRANVMEEKTDSK